MRKAKAGKRRVTKTQIKVWGEGLHRKREEILALYNHDLSVGKDSSDDGGDDLVDRANNAYNREFMFSLTDTERQVLIEIDDAIQRLDDGAYGECTHCAAEIGEARLQAVPWARYCIQCQELAERGLLVDA